MNKKEVLEIVKIATLGLIIGFSFNLVLATYLAPLNVGSNPQSKNAGLRVNQFFVEQNSSFLQKLSVGGVPGSGNSALIEEPSFLAKISEFLGLANIAQAQSTSNNPWDSLATLIVYGDISSSSLANNGNEKPVCADGLGIVIVCPNILTVVKVGSELGYIHSAINGVSGTIYCGNKNNTEMYTSCTEAYNENTEVVLDAISNLGGIIVGPNTPVTPSMPHKIVTWSGCDSVVFPGLCHVTMNSSKTIRATLSMSTN